ncbi:hypothetical protein ABIA39_008936 [Nocardia sp. GAS34]
MTVHEPEPPSFRPPHSQAAIDHVIARYRAEHDSDSTEPERQPADDQENK